MIRYGLFRFGTFAYAVPLLSLQKIVCQHSGYLLPLLPSAVAGLLVDDGSLVPLLRLLPSAGMSEMSARSAAYKVLVGSEAGTVALPADVTCGIVAEDKGSLLPAGEEGMAGVVGSFKYQAEEYQILNIDYMAMALTEEVAE